MEKFYLIVALFFVTSFTATEAFYVHKIADGGDDMPKTVQLCRRSCFKKFINENIFNQENIEKCSADSMCFMCWDYCGHLYHETRLVTVSMCSDFVCYSGCKFACTFYSMIHKETKQTTTTAEENYKLGNSVHDLQKT